MLPPSAPSLVWKVENRYLNTWKHAQSPASRPPPAARRSVTPRDTKGNARRSGNLIWLSRRSNLPGWGSEALIWFSVSYLLIPAGTSGPNKKHERRNKKKNVVIKMDHARGFTDQRFSLICKMLRVFCRNPRLECFVWGVFAPSPRPLVLVHSHDFSVRR